MSDRPVPAPAKEQQASDRSARERRAETGPERELPGHPRSGARTDADLGAGGGPAAGPPRWVTVAAIVVAATLVLGIVLLHLSGGLGPGLHGGG